MKLLRRLAPRRSPRFSAVAAVLFCLSLAGCDLFGSSGGDPCLPQIVIEPDNSSTIAVPLNDSVRLSAAVEVDDACPEPPTFKYEISWAYDEDANQELSDAELNDRLTAASFQIFACPSDVGKHLLEVRATPLTESTEPDLVRELTITIDGSSGSSNRPACYNDAIDAIVTADDINATTIGPLETALDCLEPYLDEVNVCDVQASYAAGLARFASFNAKTPEWIRERASLTLDDVNDIFNNELVPMLDRFEVVKNRGDETFQFFVDGKFNILATEEDPDLEGDQAQFIVLQGEHDYTDVWAISAVNNATRAFFQLLLAYEGLVRFILDFPDLSELPTFQDFRRLFIGELIDNPQFMMLTEDAEDRMLDAQNGFIDFFTDIEQAVILVRDETDIQYDDLFRYWDCGSDGVCDCSREDPLNPDDPGSINVPVNQFLDCPNDQSLYDDRGPDDDGTEGNLQYDEGELVGTDRVGNSTRFDTIDLPSNIDEFIEQNRLIRENIRGPNALDLDELVGSFTGGIPVTLFLATTLGLPIFELRLSEWFVTPSDVRNLVNLYSISDRDVIFELESEPYDDFGYDGKTNQQEVIVHFDNPRGLTAGTPFDAITNSDPAFDDLDPFCNPVCNDTDGIDNDGDGLADLDDVWVFGGGFDINSDFGTENNLTFDWVDWDDDFTHDPDEPSEPFEDIGVTDHRGNLINTQGAWDFADQAHTFPNGPDIGPINDIDQVDPPNGSNGYQTVIGDGSPTLVPSDRAIRENFGGNDVEGSLIDYEGLYDSFYFFFPEPTFSGVFVLPEEIPSIDGSLLTENAKLIRFFSKLLEIASVAKGVGGERRGDEADVPPREAFGHVCAEEADCIKAVCLWQPTHSVCP